MEEVDSSEL